MLMLSPRSFALLQRLPVLSKKPPMFWRPPVTAANDLFFRRGQSGIVAQDAQHKFFCRGVNTVAYSDGHMQVMSASMMGPGDCLALRIGSKLQPRLLEMKNNLRNKRYA